MAWFCFLTPKIARIDSREKVQTSRIFERCPVHPWPKFVSIAEPYFLLFFECDFISLIQPLKGTSLKSVWTVIASKNERKSLKWAWFKSRFKACYPKQTFLVSYSLISAGLPLPPVKMTWGLGSLPHLWAAANNLSLNIVMTERRANFRDGGPSGFDCKVCSLQQCILTFPPYSVWRKHIISTFQLDYAIDENILIKR